mgnify:CR=1 FL=1
MHVLTVVRTTAFSFALVAMVALSSVSGRGTEPGVPATTPPGVTLVEVTRELQTSSDQLLWVRFGGEDGATLLLSQNDAPDVSNCMDACAVEFPPLRATRDAVPFGDWSLVSRIDGPPQWAYRSHPLYTWSAEEEPGEVAVAGSAQAVGSGVGGTSHAGAVVEPVLEEGAVLFTA